MTRIFSQGNYDDRLLANFLAACDENDRHLEAINKKVDEMISDNDSLADLVFSSRVGDPIVALVHDILTRKHSIQPLSELESKVFDAVIELANELAEEKIEDEKHET